MPRIIVGLFENLSEAKRAVEELHNTTFTQDTVTLTNSASDTAAMAMLHSGQIAAQEVQFYSDGIQRGGTLVMVRVDDTHVQRIADILAKYDTLTSDTPTTKIRPLRERISANAHSFDILEADFRANYISTYADSGGHYDQYRTVYRYGYDLGTDERTRNNDWSTIEPDARRVWEQRNPDSWDQFKASIQYAWKKAGGQQ